MAAIAGCFGAAEQDLAADCEQILKALAPYGSDAPRRIDLPGAALGYRTCVHDSSDTQSAKAERYLFVADIRLDNRDEVVRALAQDCSGLSDAELLLRCWERWERQTLGRIVGDFAFILFDRKLREVLLVRDPTGQRPLFFTQFDGKVAISSMPSGLLALDGFKPEFDYDRAASRRQGIVDRSPATHFKQIWRVLPGHIASIRDGVVRQQAYWEPPVEWLDSNVDALVEAYRHTLRTAVRAQSRRRAGRLGSHLSSGWDSSAVTAFAARSEPSVIAFTAAPRPAFSGFVPKGRMADETRLAALTAQMHGLEHQIIRATDGPLGQLRRLAHLYQEPEFNVINLEWWTAVLRSASDSGVRTMLTGQMGNISANAGGLPVLAEWLRRGALRTWFREARAARRHSNPSWRGILFNSFQTWLPAPVIRALERNAGLAAPEKETSFLRPEWSQRGIAYSAQARWRADRTRPYALRLNWIRSQDPGTFRAGAFADCRIDERDPFADRRVLDFSFQISPDKYLHDGKWRPLAREALSGLVPAEVLDSPLRGYQGADWFERISPREAHQLLDEVASSHAASQLLDIQRLRLMIDKWPVGGPASSVETAIFRTGLLGALSLGVFLQEFERSII